MPVHAPDDLDRQIIDLLREDARRTIKDIASRVNLSPAPVRRRIERLEKSGVIAGYTVRVDHAKLGPSLEAFAELRYSGDMAVEEIFRILGEVPEVHDVYTTAGDPDALVYLRVDDVAHLQRAVNHLRSRGNLISTKTLIVMEHRTGESPGAEAA